MDTISLPITTLLSSALAIWLLVLSWAVIKGRRSLSLSLGDGGDDMMQRRVRAQGNLVEYAPIFVIMIALAELQGGNAIIVSLLAAAFFRRAFGTWICFCLHRKEYETAQTWNDSNTVRDWGNGDFQLGLGDRLKAARPAQTLW